jgi:CheY-like chemotaxis protein
MADNEKRILVVDDDDAIRALLMTVLRRRGLTVDSARNGSEAIERCMRCRYALVLLDLMMPVMSGYDVLAQLSQMAERPVIVVLTAGALPRQLDSQIVAGTLRKPFDIELLVDTVRGCLSNVGDITQRGDCPAADSDTLERS